MSAGTKAKAFRVRGYYMDVPARSGSDTPATVTIDCPGLFVPDSSPTPLPADVRRVLRDLHDQKRPEHKSRKLSHATWLEIGRILGRAEKRRKAGGL